MQVMHKHLANQLLHALANLLLHALANLLLHASNYSSHLSGVSNV